MITSEKAVVIFVVLVFLALVLITCLLAITTGSWALGISASALLLAIVNLIMEVSDR